MQDFDTVWADLKARCPHDLRAETPEWAAWMQRGGYAARVNGNTLNIRIPDSIIAIAQPAA